MPQSTADQLLSQIAKGSIKTLYFLDGPEEWLKEKVLEQIKAKLFPESGADLNFNIYDGSEASGAEILTSVQTMPFLSDRRLVVVRNVEQMPGPQAKIIAAELENIPSFSCLILLYRGKANRKDPLAAQIPQTQMFTFWPPFPSQLPGWISGEAARQGKKIDPEAARKLAELFPGNLQDLSSEIERLVLYTHDSPCINLSHIEGLTNPSGAAAPWELDAFVQERDLKGALSKAKALLLQGRAPEIILSALEKCLKTLLVAKALEEEGASPQELPTRLGIKGRTREENFLKGLRRYRRDELENSLLRLERCEWDIKTGALPGEEALTILLVRILRTKPAGTTSRGSGRVLTGG